MCLSWINDVTIVKRLSNEIVSQSTSSDDSGNWTGDSKMANSSQQLLLRSSDRISIPDNQQELDTLQGLVYFLLLLTCLTVIHLIYCWNIRFQASSSHSKIASLKKKVCGSIWVWLFLSTETFDTYNSILHRMFCYYSCIKHNHFWRFLEVVNVGCYRESRDPSIKFYLL